MTNPFYSDSSGTMKSETLGEGKVIWPDRPIQYRNREANAGGLSHAFAGYYYVGVAVSEANGQDLDGSEQPFELSVKLDGELSEGPAWRPSEKNGPTPSDQPILASGDGATPAELRDTQGNAEGEESDANAQNTSASGDSEPPMWPIPVAGVAIVGLIIGTVIGMKNRRPRM